MYACQIYSEFSSKPLLAKKDTESPDFLHPPLILVITLPTVPPIALSKQGCTPNTPYYINTLLTHSFSNFLQLPCPHSFCCLVALAECGIMPHVLLCLILWVPELVETWYHSTSNTLLYVLCNRASNLLKV